jgi:hypothetical protein
VSFGLLNQDYTALQQDSKLSPIVKRTSDYLTWKNHVEINMNKKLLLALSTIVFVFFSSLSAAETYVEVFECELGEGKTVEDAHAANRKWLKWVTENVGKGTVSSSAGTAVVGNTETFIWVDTYPDLATWSATKTALDTKEGKAALKDLFKDITDCKENRLWKLEPTE